MQPGIYRYTHLLDLLGGTQHVQPDAHLVQQIGQLENDARAGDPDAVEFLLNLSLRMDSLGSQARATLSALTPRTGTPTRTSELVQAGRKQFEALPVTIAPADFEISDTRLRFAHEQVPMRTMRAEVLPLPMDDSKEHADALSASLLKRAQALDDNQAAAFHLNIAPRHTKSAHWVTLVVHKEQGNLHCELIDTLANPARETRLVKFLMRSLPGCHFASHSLNAQHHVVNGCGLLGVSLLRELDRARQCARPQSITATVPAILNAWMKLLPGQQYRHALNVHDTLAIAPLN